MGPAKLGYYCRRIRHTDRGLQAGSPEIRAPLSHETETEKIIEIARVGDFDPSSRIWRFLRKGAPVRDNQYQGRLRRERQGRAEPRHAVPCTHRVLPGERYWAGGCAAGNDGARAQLLFWGWFRQKGHGVPLVGASLP